MPTTYIIGHTKPDADAVIAPMALAFLYRALNDRDRENPIAVISEEINPETAFIFKKFKVDAPKILTAPDVKPEDKLVLVDHNEVEQRLKGISSEQIVEILDHHSININLRNPISITTRPWGSSSSIVYHQMKQSGVKPDKILASLMLSAVLSDTVGFKSSTCTPLDREIGTELAEIAGVKDVDALTLEIFRAKSDVSKLTDDEIIKNDHKVSVFGDKKVMVSQVETVEQDYFLDTRKTGLLASMQKIKSDEKIDLIYLVITDVLAVDSKMFVLSEKEAKVAEKAFGGEINQKVLDLGPRMSRKKEIFPELERVLEE